MKVLILVEYLYLGGIERLLQQVASSIELDRCELIFYAYMTPELEGIGQQIAQTGCKVYFELKKDGYDFGLVRRLRRVVKKHGINTVHTHDFGPMEYAVSLKCLMPRLRLVHSQHTLHGLLKRRDYLLFFQLASWFYYKVHMVSPVVLDEIKGRSFFLADKRCKVTYNGIKIGDTPIVASQFDKPLRILSVCRLSPEKNLPFTLHALSELKKSGIAFHFIHCGAGDGLYTETIQSLIHSLDLVDCVELKGFQEDVSSELRWANIFISSSLTEGHPLAVIEAMEQGLLCFLSDIPAHHFAPDDIAYFFRFDPKQLSGLIKSTLLSRSSSELKGRRHRAIHLVRSRFSINHMIAQYLDSYQQAFIE